MLYAHVSALVDKGAFLLGKESNRIIIFINDEWLTAVYSKEEKWWTQQMGHTPLHNCAVID